LTPAEAWDLTPRELLAYSRGVAQRDTDRQRLAVAAAWHVAALSRAKRFPKLRELMRRITGPRQRPRVLTPKQQVNQLEAIALAFGGRPLNRIPKLKRTVEP
jgi:hypothetical protein